MRSVKNGMAVTTRTSAIRSVVYVRIMKYDECNECDECGGYDH